MRPELRAVLAHAPAFVDEAPLGAGDAQLVLRPAALLGVLRIELAEVLPDDLLGTVALYARGAVVPGGYGTRDVEHEDRIVAYALDEQSKPLLAVPKTFLVLAPLREVASNLCESKQRLIGAVQGGDDDVRPEARAILSHPPALVLEASLRGRHPQLMRREIFQSRADRTG